MSGDDHKDKDDDHEEGGIEAFLQLPTKKPKISSRVQKSEKEVVILLQYKKMQKSL